MSLGPRAVTRIIAILLATAGCFPDSTVPARVVREVASVPITPLQSGYRARPAPVPASRVGTAARTHQANVRQRENR